MLRRVLLFVFVGSFALLWGGAPKLISYQGRLTDASGAPITGTHDITFCIYNTETGGTPLWTETHTSVALNAEGLFSVMLGSIVPLSLPFTEPYWLGISVDGGSEICRYQLGASPYTLSLVDTVHTTSAGVTFRFTGNSYAQLAGFLDGNYVGVYGYSGSWGANTGGVVGENENGNLGILGNHTYAGYFSGTAYSPNPVLYAVNDVTESDGRGIKGVCDNSDYYGIGVEGVGGYIGVRGEVTPEGSDAYYGLYGYVVGGSGANYGVLGHADNSNASCGVRGEALGDNFSYGVYGYANGDGANYAVYGTTPRSGPDDWSGYFTGRVYLHGNVGIARSNPISVLDIGRDTISIGWGFTFQTHEPSFGDEDSVRTFIHCGWSGTYGDYLYIGSVGNRSNTDQGAIIISEHRIRFGKGSDDGRDLSVEHASINLDNGWFSCKVLEITGGSDLAEPFEVTDPEEVKPGMVLAIDPEHPGKLKVADRAYDPCVAGVVSGAGGIEPGILLRQRESEADGTVPVAMSGRVYVLADATYEPIEPGDFLTTSNTPGYAMKATNLERARGAILGKAMTGLESGKGLVLVLINLQ